MILLGSILPCGLGAQGYVKLNGAYALAGVINPAVEMRISPHASVQFEAVYSPWRGIYDPHDRCDKPMRFAIVMGEYRRYSRSANDGWYVAGNAGMMGFRMSKPYIDGWQLRLQNRYCKGYGMMIGLAVGWERRFARRWLIDIFGGWSYMCSWYNGYSMDGAIDMYPHRDLMPSPADPFNGSAEWLPNKAGVSIGILLFDPHKNI